MIYGLIGILVLVPFVGNHLISQRRKESVAYVVQLDGSSLLVGVLILTVMITPIMVAIVVDALRSVPRGVDRGGRRAGRQSLAGAVDDRRPGGAPGDRRRRGARHGAGAGRGDHALDGLGLGRLRAEPARRRHLLPRAGPPAGRDDRRQRRGPLGDTVRADDLRIRGGAAGLDAFLSFAGWYIRRMIRRQGMTPGAIQGGGVPWAPGLPVSPAWPGQE